MRTIDADALHDTILRDEKLDGKDVNWAVNRIISHILNAPTIEERPKGKWIADDEWGNCHCSICNFENNHQPYFCENCGADMRGEENG